MVCCGKAQQGYQLTWMDAKVDDWVVTPRRGKAVEINALWYNALRLLEGWASRAWRRAGGARLWRPRAPRARVVQPAILVRDGGYLYDVVDGEAGDDAACRPNQVLAISLDHPVLDRERWEPVMKVVRDRLLTPVGLRSLAPGHPDYKPKYYGDLRSRDAAYHQGRSGRWLIGPFVDAWLKIHPDDCQGARQLPRGFRAHLDRSLRRIDQRDLRRRSPVYSRGMHRPGLERRRSAAVPREDRRARTQRVDERRRGYRRLTRGTGSQS